MDDLISKLALQSCQNTVIGSPLQRGVSGGEVSLCPSASCAAWQDRQAVVYA